MTARDDTPLVDPARMACLGGGAHAVVAVDSNGDDVLWVLVAKDVDGPTSADGCACSRHAPHEQLGPLPPPYPGRVRWSPLRCGGNTAAGASCRAPVANPGDRCHHHRSPLVRKATP